MLYEIVISDSWPYSLIGIPSKILKKCFSAHKTLKKDPYGGGGKSKKLNNPKFKNVYRYKLHRYRIIYAIGKNYVRLLTIRKRNEDTYKNIFSSPGDFAFQLDIPPQTPRSIPTTHWDGEYVPEKETENNKQSIEIEEDELSETEEDEDTETEEEHYSFYNEYFLKHLKIPEIYWNTILLCKNEVDIIDADIPENIIEKIVYLNEKPLELIIDEPVYDLPSLEDLEKFLKGTLKGFLLKLDPEQERVSRKNIKGPILVKGGPGTGKSLVALYRIRNILNPEVQISLFEERSPKVLFVTYTNTLVEHSKQLLNPLLDKLTENVTISTMDSMTHQIITESGGDYNPADNNNKFEAFNQAIHVLIKKQKELTNEIMNIVGRLKIVYIIDEFDWVIEGRGISSLDQYLSENRAGRGTPLNINQRTLLWKLHEEYIDKLKQKNKKTYNMLRQEALEIILNNPGLSKFIYDSVVVDEAQDLTPVAIRLCLALCKNKQGLYMTADAGQSIYQRGFSWKRIDEMIDFRGKTTILKNNYRSTKQIADCSTQLLNCSKDGDVETRDLISVKQGLKPILFSYSSIDDEISKMKDCIDAFLKTLKLDYDSVSVLVRTKKTGEILNQKLNEIGIPSEIVKGDNLNYDNIKVKVMTLHSAKGLEFPIVVIARVNKDQTPGVFGILDSEEKQAKINIERNLLSVGMTRAMRFLAVSYNTQNPSDFINEMDKSLWSVIA